MPHEIDRILSAAGSGTWLIEPVKGAQIASVLALRAHGLSSDWAGELNQPVYAADSIAGRSGAVHVLKLHGTIMPRGGMMSRMSGASTLDQFQKAFLRAADDQSAQAIVLEIDSPGGMVDQVPETAAMIYASRRAGRPIIAVANTVAASAAYWIAAACDEIVVTPSGVVGSIGVYTMHDDISGALEKQGVKRTVIFEGDRKTEGSPHTAMSKDALAARQAEVKYTYDMFSANVAKYRGVPVAVVRADPEKAETHFGGGRSYHAKDALRLGMVDRIATFDDTLMRAARGGRKRRINLAQKRLSLI
ncbi:MAG: S49 family peptidase [Rhodobacteraceae bacterium]|nr:S49 family peptidase [Paracoccaceae bacterium]